MSETDDAAARAAAIWHSETQIRDYLADTERRERARRPQWDFMALLLPFDDDVTDLGGLVRFHDEYELPCLRGLNGNRRNDDGVRVGAKNQGDLHE